MLKIAAAGRHVGLAADRPDDLRAQLQARGCNVRRVNRFIELAVLGAMQCRDALPAGDTALYLAAETPMLTDCVRALRSTIAEQRPPTPFEFMNISGNMAGFYIAQLLAISGPQLAVARHDAGLEAVLELLALRLRRHRRALIGCVEECVWPLAEQRQRLGLADDATLHETSHWFVVDADAVRPLCLVEAPRQFVSRDAVDALLESQPPDTVLALHPALAARDVVGQTRLQRQPPVAIAGQGATAEALHRYVISDERRPWLHLSHSGGRWYALAARRPD